MCWWLVSYSAHPEVSEDAPRYAAHDTPVLDLGWSGVAVHAGQFELSCGS